MYQPYAAPIGLTRGWMPLTRYGHPDILFKYQAGDNISALGGLGGTFTRADASTCATYVDAAGVVQLAAANVLRDQHYINGVCHALQEGTRQNVCLQSEDFSVTWAAVGTPTRSGAAASCGIVDLDLLGDDAGGALEGYTQTITFTGNAVKTVSIHFKQGTSVSSVIRLRDTTAPADRLLATITWSSGVPVVTMTTGTNILGGTSAQALGNGVYRALLATTSVTAANTNSLQVYPATDSALDTTATGDIYFGGVQCENATVPSSYIPTTTGAVTRAADAFSFPFSYPPNAMTVYVKGYDLGTQQSTLGYYEVGAFGTNPATGIYCSSATNVATFHQNGAAQVNSGAQTGCSYGDTFEFRQVLSSTGVTRLGLAKNGAAETLDTASAVNALGATWANQTLKIGQYTGVAQGFAAFQKMAIASGIKSLDQMRGL